jgi:hypothetical protein
MTYKHKQVLKLVVLTDEDIMTMNFEEQLNLVQEAIKLGLKKNTHLPHLAEARRLVSVERMLVSLT